MLSEHTNQRPGNQEFSRQRACGTLAPRRLSPHNARVLAFGRWDLLASVTVVVLLGSLVVLSLGAARPNSSAVQCLNNLRQLGVAWKAYAADAQDQVVNNFGVNDTTLAIQNGFFNNWANNVMTWSASAQTIDISNTNLNWVRRGPLGPYLNGSVSVYQCPADHFLSSVQRAARYQRRARSYSMNSVFGHFSLAGDSTWKTPPLNWAFPQYLQYLKQSTVPKPAKTWVLIDEHPDSINDGFFLNSPGATSWQDLPASLHDGACGISFADGHAEMRKWLSHTSNYGQVNYNYPLPKTFDASGRKDFAWYLEHTGYLDAASGKPRFNY